ncbi:CRISPR-associated protein Cas5 [Leptospira weilii]|nr:CRISPR-associated protein Cas5 [Leptospira weilii]QDK28765.1 CRISPR-associated protein Cas5 [Leptospira weilii]
MYKKRAKQILLPLYQFVCSFTNPYKIEYRSSEVVPTFRGRILGTLLYRDE